MELKVFELQSNCVYTSKGIKINCHICGKTFSPLVGLMIPTDETDYYLGTYCRNYIIILDDTSSLCNCQDWSYINLVLEGKPVTGFYMWMYDHKDDMENKVYNFKEELNK